MLTTIRLDGAPGKLFGKEWKLAVSSPAEAIALIDANKPGLKRWIINNREGLDGFRVTCTYENGIEEDLDDKSYMMPRKNLTSIRFTPIAKGASSVVRIIVGVILIVASPYLGPWATQVGITLIASGVIEMLSPRPKLGNTNDANDIKSYYFDGPVNTEEQGSPVPLIYGRVMAGSFAVSASISTDDI